MLTRNELGKITSLIAFLDNGFATPTSVLSVEAILGDSNGESVGRVAWSPSIKGHVYFAPGEEIE